MNNSEILEMMEQYALAGKDARTLFDDCTARLAAGKTPLGLNQWVKSDKPLMEDFNEDNRVIDAKLQELAENKLDKVTPVLETPVLVNNHTDYIRVLRTAAGERHIYINVYNRPISEGVVIATLPEDFRPPVDIIFNGSLLVSSPNRLGQCIFSITTDGTVSILHVSDTYFTRAIGNATLM